MHPFVSFYFHYNQVQGQMLAVPGVTPLLGFFHEGLWYVWLSSGRIWLGVLLLIVLAIYLHSKTAMFINVMHRFTKENAKDKN